MADTLEEQRHNLTHAVGECILAWAAVESALVMLFADVIGADFYVSNAVWDGIIAFKGKLDSLTGAINVSDASETLKESWKKIASELEKRYKARNEVAHSALHKISKDKSPLRWRVVPYPSINKFDYGLGLSELQDRTAIFNRLSEKVVEYQARWLGQIQ